MSDYDSDEEMGTNINRMKNKKHLYNNIISDEEPKIIYVKEPKKKINKINKIKSNKNFYINLIIFSLIFFLVNNYELNTYLVSKKFSYNIIIFIKLVLFLALYYFYQYLIK